MTRKAVFMSEEEHAHLTALLAKEIADSNRPSMTYGELIKKLREFYQANKV